MEIYIKAFIGLVILFMSFYLSTRYKKEGKEGLMALWGLIGAGSGIYALYYVVIISNNALVNLLSN